ncbi:MAG: Mrp/NBP35 family ATP-binding protein [Clostridia bacterium]|nr:Mrp/NBP35 family ATP-binding protein [Clostridia bacterium]
MSESNCSGNCATCSSNCKDRKQEDFFEPTGEFNIIKHVVAVVSGKGGVGKSAVTAMLAVLLSRKGYKVGILDADITGPSIPKAFGITAPAMQNEMGIIPAQTENGIKIISVNMMLKEHDQPVVWRGPVIAGLVKQFWQQVVWGELDYLLIDCPPGTGDVPLTVFQTIRLDGAVVVTTPQDLVSLIVKKALNMAKLMNINVLGVVENMSYVVCPDCGKKFSVFGESGDKYSELGIKLLGSMPIDPNLAAMIDCGAVERISGDFLNAAVSEIEKL